MRLAPPTPIRIDIHPMTKSAFFAATAALAIAAAPGIAAEATPVEWSQLPDPAAQEFEDPYRDLAPQQMSDLMSLVRLREELGVEGLAIEERRQLEGRSEKLEAALQAGGIDVEWLLSQRWVVADRRRQAAVGSNGALDGQAVEIAGFLILAPPTDSGEASAYLLPDRGVCNHLPPPPPNQLVRLLMKNAPETGGSCVPAAVRGTLRAEETRYEVIVIDHSLPMWSAWTLEADDVRAVGPYESDSPIQH
jgi:hypothetical protein